MWLPLPGLIWFAVPNLLAVPNCTNVVLFTYKNGTSFTYRYQALFGELNSSLANTENTLVDEKHQEMDDRKKTNDLKIQELQQAIEQDSQLLDRLSQVNKEHETADGANGNALKAIIEEAKQKNLVEEEEVQRNYSKFLIDSQIFLDAHHLESVTHMECKVMISPPGEYLPDVAHQRLAHAAHRWQYFLSLMAWMVVAYVMCALLIVKVFKDVVPRVKAWRQKAASIESQELDEESNERQLLLKRGDELPKTPAVRVLPVWAHMLYHIYCGSLSAAAATRGWVSPDSGFDWELWVLWLGTIMTATLAALTVHLNHLPEGQRCPTYMETIKGCVVPFVPVLGELLDTFQDWILAAMCFQQASVAGWCLGVPSVFIMVFSNYVLRHMPGGPRFLLSAYVPLLEVKLKEPKAAPDAVADDAAAEDYFSAFKKMVRHQLEEISSLEKLMIAVTEDVPQATVKLLMALFLGGQGKWVRQALAIQFIKLIAAVVLPPLIKMARGKAVNLKVSVQTSLEALYFALLIPFTGSEEGIKKKIEVMTELAAKSKKLEDVGQLRDFQDGLLDELTRLYGREHHRTLELMSDYGNTLCKLGDFDEAVELREELLKLLRKTKGSDNHPPMTVQTLVELAITYRHVGQFQKAKPLLEEARSAHRELRDMQKPHDINSVEAMFQLGVSLRDSADGDWDAPKQLLEDVSAQRRDQDKLMEEDASAQRRDLEKVASARQRDQDREASKQLLEEVIARRRDLPEEQEAETVRAMTQLGITLRSLGDLQRSKQLLEEAAVGLLPDATPVTVEAKVQLAVTLRELGDFPRSRQLLEEARHQLRDDVDTQVVSVHKVMTSLHEPMIQLAKTYIAMDDKFHDTSSVDAMYKLAHQCNERANLLQNVLAQQRSRDGKAPPEALMFRHDDTTVYVQSAVISRAVTELKKLKVKLFNETLSQRSRLPGSNQTEIVSAMIELAGEYRATGDLEESKALWERIVTQRRASPSLGDHHPDTVQAIIEVACDWRELGNWKESKKLLVDAQNALKAAAQQPQPQRDGANQHEAMQWKVMDQLPPALWAGAMEELTELKMLLEKILELKGKLKIKGDDGEEHPDLLQHPDLLHQAVRLAIVCREVGDLKKSKSLLELALKQQETVAPQQQQQQNTVELKVQLALTLGAMGELEQLRRLLS